MVTTKKAAETAAVDYSTMNVFQKLQLARVRFLEAGVDKSGKHMKLEYKYFELADIVPKAEQIFLEIGLMMVPSMSMTVRTTLTSLHRTLPSPPSCPTLAIRSQTKCRRPAAPSPTFAAICGSSFLTLWSMTVSTAVNMT